MNLESEKIDSILSNLDKIALGPASKRNLQLENRKRSKLVVPPEF